MEAPRIDRYPAMLARRFLMVNSDPKQSKWAGHRGLNQARSSRRPSEKLTTEKRQRRQWQQRVSMSVSSPWAHFFREQDDTLSMFEKDQLMRGS